MSAEEHPVPHLLAPPDALSPPLRATVLHFAPLGHWLRLDLGWLLPCGRLGSIRDDRQGSLARARVPRSRSSFNTTLPARRVRGDLSGRGTPDARRREAA
ncbi:hypothetical protein MLP_41350 [Microlunatus phosphovorus NM-1]|uniref:Uncharacterized protein n=1 Tax=Microlunatus phosphovorus (strain ATCC 700054 / DSM 10555 / JCM 9379 / NBRC 101784 / NCIMB 13414 / VKM Ac-1990 / NM-1) TaxID=1032480 RepID=F5XRT6_MICPN|nr:hypothetical protein MLP_41350 [Microlunatus phosphovorus NM-1]